MAVYVTGDTHGGPERDRLSSTKFPEGTTLHKDDYVIIAGDFGYIWSNKHHTLRERYQLKWFTRKPWTTCFIDGNHENHMRLAKLRPLERFGATVGRAAEDVYYLKRGHVYEIDGLKVFAMGGASSSPSDKRRRTEGVGWWAAEVPSPEERAEAERNLEACGWKVDIVVTHDAPSGLASGIGRFRVTHKEDEYTDWLRSIAQKLEFDCWYFGHHHVNASFVDGRFRAVYDDIVNVRTGKVVTASIVPEDELAYARGIGD